MKKSDEMNYNSNSNTDQSKEKGNVIPPQSTKNSIHSKIKGFSFQLENTNGTFTNKEKLDKLNQMHEDNKQNFQILDDDKEKNKNYHKNKISMVAVPSQLLKEKNDDEENVGLSNRADKSNKQSGGKLIKNNSNLSQTITLNGTKIDTPLNITDLIKDQNFVPLGKEVLKKDYEKYEPARHSAKSLSVVRSFAANTHQGTVRKYNEDRVSIILNIVKPNTYKGTYWPSCSFFAVFDGHGGSKCADYLKDNLHNYVKF